MKNQRKPVKVRRNQENSSPNPTAVLESLRVTLMEYKKKLDTTTEELAKMKKLSDTLNREVDNCKEMIWAKDKSLEDAQKNYTRTAKELNRIRSQYAEMEGSFTKLKVDMQSSASNQTKDRKRVQELSEEIMKLVKRHKADDEEKLAYLHGMYQRLLSGRIMVPTKDQGLNQLTWADLTTIVYEQVSALVNASLRADEKICHLEEALKMKEEALDDIQKSHEDQLNKLSSLTKERELSWQKQKEEIEGHYSQLLSELQARSKKSQAMADQAWEKIRMTGTVQHGLETECSELRNQTSESQKQNNALLATCSLLFGAIYPMCSRSNHLAMQRRMLEEQLNNWEFCRERAELLVHTLGSELKSVKGEIETDISKTARRHPLLVFRIGAVAVLAANRLKYFGRNSANKNMFVTYDSVISHQSGVVVCTGGIKPTQKKLLDDTYSDEMDIETVQRQTQTSVINWLSNEELRSTVLTTTSELVDMAYRLKDKDKASSVETRALVNTARSSFTNLLDKVSRQFEEVCSQPTLAIRERNSLVRLLGRGLHRICAKMPVEEKKYIATLQDLMGALQNHILDFTQRLHSVEVERRELLVELNQLRGDRHDIPQKDDDGRSNSDIEPVKDKEPQYVAMEKFESVCYELNNALRREQQAQQLLMEQSRQFEELTLRLDLYTSEGMEKEQTLGEAIHSLAEMKLELKRKEQNLRQLNRQLITLDSDKKSMQSNISDAEKALRTAARDKEILAVYIKSVENALEQARREMSLSKEFNGKDVSLSKVLLDADFIPPDVGKAGPELIACQNLVGAFVDAQTQAFSKIKALEEEIESHRKHVNMLKRELSDAVHREYDAETEAPTRDGLNRQGPDPNITSSSECFMPLREDSDVSFSLPKTATPKASAVHSKRGERSSPKFHTPGRSSRSHNIRPKAFEPHGR
ncbi:hypothetical protein KUTeg_017609 [Tegillarca granosa]|uniref:Coiled-coil domain-containing protein 171 n=1 Tax=Tegillarca granosa TaxID=220873 RepID=A0ABQ9EFE8_TEGGR|nr:hypothetical protein KUTeg_017609 [Tegillarca granosa]